MLSPFSSKNCKKNDVGQPLENPSQQVVAAPLHHMREGAAASARHRIECEGHTR